MEKKIYRQAIAQFDLKNEIQGLHPVDVDGIKYDLGEDTGLRHYFIDTDVKNGQTYYYALVSYDRGHVEQTATGEISGISPSESPGVVKVSTAGVVEYLDVNTAIVIPQAPVAGYNPPHLVDGINHLDPGTGDITVDLLNPTQLRDGNEYQITFSDTSLFAQNANPGFSLTNLTSNELLIDNFALSEGQATSPIVDGMVINIQNDTSVTIIEAETGWVKSDGQILFQAGIDSSLLGRHVSYPADFEITFYDHVVDTSLALLFGQKAIPANFDIYNLTENRKNGFFDFG